MAEVTKSELKGTDTDKTSGVAIIKAEYVIENHERTLVLDHVAEQDKEKLAATDENDSPQPYKKQKLEKGDVKLKGQNKARPSPYKREKENSLCLTLVDVLENEELPKCQNAKCTFMHDIPAFLAAKSPDIGPECHVFMTQGRCPRGASCRFGSQHLTPDGRNKVNEELYKKFMLTQPNRNRINKTLQQSLRKHNYDFSRTDATISKYDRLRKKEIAEFEVNLKCDKEKAKNVQEDKVVSDQGAADEKLVSDEGAADEKLVSDQGAADEKLVSDEGAADEKLVSDEGAADEKVNTCGAVTDEDIVFTRKDEKRKIDWKGKLYLSPLTTVGNLPFRRICKQFGADITCGEMSMANPFLHGALQEWALIKRHESEDLFGVQLCGNNPYGMTRAAQVIEDVAKVDFIDVNLGCPIDLVYNQGCGAGLLRRDKVLRSVIMCMSDTINIPLTIKTRIGVYTDRNITHNLMPKFRDWGASLVTVHGRSREQRFTKSPDWSYIEECAKLGAPCPVFGNGDVLSFEDYEQAFVDSPSISGVMIGRGALIKPWIFTEIKEKRHWDISSSERFDILKKYVNNGLEHWGSDTKGVENTRRFLLEWLSFLHRYIPVGLLECPPQKINQRPPYYRGRDDLETLMASPSCADWIKISEMLLGPVPDNFMFLPKHKANSWK